MWDGECAIVILLRLEFVVLVEFSFCNLIVCNVDGGVFVCDIS